MSEPNAEFVRFYCQCETKLKVPKAAAGKRVQCPKCGFKLVVPASSSTEPLRDASPQLEPPSTLEDGDGLLDDLMSLEQAAETTGQRSVVESQKPCPNCGVSLSPEAAMCLACGRDLSAQKEAKKSPKAAAVAGGLAKRGGRFALGCTLSGAGALIGAVVWTVVCFVTGYEFSLIAWGVGLLAGYGMALGYGKQNGKAGIVATLMAGGGEAG